MTFAQRLKYYLIGFMTSLLLLMIIFGNRMFSWSYLPNDRVLAEIKTKTIEFSSASKSFLEQSKTTEKFILDTVLVKGKIDFKQSHAQAEPCPDYFLNYKNWKITFTKCKEKVTINNIRQN